MIYKKYYYAKAKIKGGRKYPNINGTVYFKQMANGVLVTTMVYNLPQVKDKCTGRFFGFHIHKGSSCSRKCR